MAFQPLPLPQEPFRSIHVSNDADQRNVGRESKFLSQNSSSNGGEGFCVGASVGQEDAAGVNSQIQVFLARPTTCGDPEIARAGESDIEPGEKGMFEVQRSRNLKNAWDGGIFSEGEAGDESRADVMSVGEGGGDVGDERAASAKSRGDAPGLAGGKIEIGANNSRSGFAIFWGEAFGVGGQSYDNFDAERTEDAHLFVGPVCADGGLHDVQDLHGGDHSNPEWGTRWVQIHADSAGG